MTFPRSLLLILAACEVGTADPIAQLPDTALAPPYGTLVFSGPAEVPRGESGVYTVTGAHPGETVFLARSINGPGAGPCIGALGNQCLSLLAPVQVATSASADVNGTLTFTLPVGVLPVGAAPGLQVVTIRGLRGVDSLLSNAVQTEVVTRVEGCTDPAALNLDPDANVDDGTCEYNDRTIPGFSGVLGPNLSAQGLIQCAGTSSASTTSTAFLTPCQGADNLMFGCSVDADETAEYLTPVLDASGANLTDTTCDAWDSGALSSYGTGHILSFDVSTPPACNNYNVGYDLYADFVSPQWGCAGTYNTHASGGRVFAYINAPSAVFGCEDPAASNYDPNANQDDGSCLYGVVSGFTGHVGPQLGEGWLQCGGTNSGSTTSAGFLGLCEGYTEIRFACSVDAGATAEYTSAGFSVAGPLLDGTCDDWTGGSLSPYFTGHILSIDDTNPACNQFSVGYDMYVDMVSPQWGCAGGFNTQSTGGAVWAYVR
jgi:hypothetical protein